MKILSFSKEPVVTEEELQRLPEDSSRPWKPITLHPAVLSTAALLSGLLAALVGALIWLDETRGALILPSGPNGFSNGQLFLFRYLPTIVVVLYGMAWSWIDLDVKRTEPWFQLSQCGSSGVSASDSLLLHYPVDFLPIVPYKAAKRR